MSKYVDKFTGLGDEPILVRDSEARAMIAELQGQVDDASIIFIGDSYGLNTAIEDGGDSWATILERDIFPGAAYLIEGGTGFGSDLYTLHNWLINLQAYVTTLTTAEKNAIREVVCVGGANDANLINNGTLTAVLLATRINSFCEYVAENLPNAVVKCAFVGWYLSNARHPAYLQARDTYAGILAKNYRYYANGEPILMGNDTIGAINQIHPLTDSSVELARFITSMVTGGMYHCCRQVDVTMDTTNTDFDSMDNFYYLKCAYDGDMATLSVVGGYYNTFFRLNFAAPGQAVAQGVYKIGKLTGTPVGGLVPSMVELTGYAYAAGAVLIGPVPLQFAVQDNNLLIKVTNISDTIRSLLVPSFSLMIPYRFA